MNEIGIGARIARLRREKGITQEELARQMGVSNQSVSKWENGQSCPDIGLLPALAGYFHVTTDALLGHVGNRPDDLPQTVHSVLSALPWEDAAEMAGQLVRMLHTALLAKCAYPGEDQTPVWATEQALRHAKEGTWGESGFYRPALTGFMRGDAVLFSGNTPQRLSRARYAGTAALLRTMAAPRVLQVFLALYELTAQSETAFAAAAAVAERAGVPTETAEEILTGPLAPYLEEGEPEAAWRIAGASMGLPPLLYLLCPIGAE